MERLYKCKNGVEEKTRFVVGSNAETRPHWRKAKSSKEKREENQRQAARELGRILNCNASPEGWWVKLDFDSASWDKLFSCMDPDQILRESKRQGVLFLRRLKRRAGSDVKCAYIASDMDGKTKEPVRIHMHLVIMGAEEQDIRDCWNYGACTDVRHLYNQEDYAPMAAYMVDQVRSLENFKKYTCTKNMEKPEVFDRVVKGDPEEEIRVQTGAKVLDRVPPKAGSVTQYVRYKRRPRAPKRGGHKEDGLPRPDGLAMTEDGGQKKGGGGFEFSQASWG